MRKCLKTSAIGTNNSTGNVTSEKWGEATWHVDQRGWGETQSSLHLHTRWYKVRVCERQGGSKRPASFTDNTTTGEEAQLRTLTVHTQYSYIYVWRRRLEIDFRDLRYIKQTWNLKKKNTQKKNSGDGLWVLDKGPVSGEVHESVVYYHAAWFSAGCTFRNLNSNCENQHGNISLAVLFPLHTMNTCVSLFVHKSVTGQWLTDVHCRIWCNTAVLNFNELLHLGNFQAGKNDITLGMSEEDFRVNRALS